MRTNLFCYYCGTIPNDTAGNPGEWSVKMCHPDEPGVVKTHHTACIAERLNRYVKLKSAAENVLWILRDIENPSTLEKNCIDEFFKILEEE